MELPAEEVMAQPETVCLLVPQGPRSSLNIEAVHGTIEVSRETGSPEMDRLWAADPLIEV